MRKKKKTGPKNRNKYYFNFMREQPTVGWRTGPESQCQRLSQHNRLIGDSDPSCLYFIFASTAREMLKKKKKQLPYRQRKRD